MTDPKIIEFSRFRGEGSVSLAEEGSRTLIRRAVSPGEAHAIRSAIAAMGKAKELQLRLTLARNLGRLLEPIRGKSAVTGALAAAGIGGTPPSTRRLPRFAIFGDADKTPDAKGLSPSIGIYVRIAEGVAPALGLTADQAVSELVQGTSLDPGIPPSESVIEPGDSAFVDSLSGLAAMLQAACHSVIARYDLGAYFRQIARHRLISGNCGQTYGVSDHPAAAGPAEAEFWLARLDLLPMVRLVTYEPDPIGAAFSVKLCRRHASAKLAASALCMREVVVVIGPFSVTHRPVGILLDIPYLEVSGPVTARTFGYPPDGPDIHLETAAGASEWRLVVDEAGAVARGVGWLSEIPAPAGGLPSISETNLFVMLHKRFRDVGLGGVIDLAANASLTFAFAEPGRAPAGTVPGYLERTLLAGQEDSNRLDRLLHRSAADLVANLAVVLAELDDIVANRQANFMRDQTT